MPKRLTYADLPTYIQLALTDDPHEFVRVFGNVETLEALRRLTNNRFWRMVGEAASRANP